MPELPEVETIKQGVNSILRNKKIENIIIRYPTLRYPIPKDLDRIKNKKIVDIKRRAKYLLIYFEQDILVVHFGMTGIFRSSKKFEAPQKHDHIVFKLNNQSYLYYNDVRRFGFVKLYSKNEIMTELQNLGPEPLSDDFNSLYFQNQLSHLKVNIKSVLMNSKIVVGVGNIYANEILFRSSIHPKKKANNLNFSQIKNLVEIIKIVLQNAIEQGGTTLKDFKKIDGDLGYFSQSLLIYGKNNQPCPRCGSPIKKEQIQQRASFYCNHCQK